MLLNYVDKDGIIKNLASINNRKKKVLMYWIFLKGTKGENKHKNCIKISVETY